MNKKTWSTPVMENLNSSGIHGAGAKGTIGSEQSSTAPGHFSGSPNHRSVMTFQTVSRILVNQASNVDSVSEIARGSTCCDTGPS